VLPNLSVVWVIFFVLLLTMILDRLLLRPLTRVMGQREGAIRSARELAELSRARAEAAADEFETRTRAARADVYRQMEERRRAALERRTKLVAETRAEIERSITEATERIQHQAVQARAALERDADLLASAIVERVLGRKIS
jgi:F0F1-type ATP synthase membrane subunit b/b'